MKKISDNSVSLSSENDIESSIIESSISSSDIHGHHIGGNYKKLYGKHN
jgi:hypothetical protein